MIETQMRINIRKDGRKRNIDTLLPVLVSSEISEQLTALASGKVQIYIKDMQLPIPGIEQGGDILYLTLKLVNRDTSIDLIKEVRDIVKDVCTRYRLFYRTHLAQVCQ